MFTLPFNNDDIGKASSLAKSLGTLNNSILKGRGNKAGILGEIALCNYLGIKYENHGHGYDILWKGKKLEIKSKRRTADPKPNYEVSVAETSQHQRPDLFVFLSLTFETKLKPHNTYHMLKNIWLCGCYGGNEFYRDARLICKGERDESNKFVAHQNMYNLPLSKLLDFRSQ